MKKTFLGRNQILRRAANVALKQQLNSWLHCKLHTKTAFLSLFFQIATIHFNSPENFIYNFKILVKYEMSVKSKAELAQFDNEQSVVKWMSITDDNEQRRVLSQLCYMEYTDQIKTVINAGVSPNVHNHKPHQSASSFVSF